jgi:hypothetical protein
LLDRLQERREVLAKAYLRATELHDKVNAARQVVDRAARELEQARIALRTLEQDDIQVAQRMTEAIRLGQSLPTPANGHDRQYVVDRVTACETALATFNRELADANAGLADALGYLRKCAAGVIGGLVEREVENLRALEVQAGIARRELISVSETWFADQATGPIKLSNFAGQYLADPPPHYSEQRRGNVSAWKELFDRLVAGNADADFELKD